MPFWAWSCSVKLSELGVFLCLLKWLFKQVSDLLNEIDTRSEFFFYCRRFLFAVDLDTWRIIWFVWMSYPIWIFKLIKYTRIYSEYIHWGAKDILLVIGWFGSYQSKHWEKMSPLNPSSVRHVPLVGSCWTLPKLMDSGGRTPMAHFFSHFHTFAFTENVQIIGWNFFINFEWLSWVSGGDCVLMLRLL